MKVGTEEALIILTKKISVWRLGLIMKGKMMASQIVSQPFRKKKTISDYSQSGNAQMSSVIADCSVSRTVLGTPTSPRGGWSC